MTLNPSILLMYERRTYGANYTPRSLICSHVKEAPHLYRTVEHGCGGLRVEFNGRLYQYDHWKIEPEPASGTERITLYLRECRKEN